MSNSPPRSRFVLLEDNVGEIKTRQLVIMLIMNGWCTGASPHAMSVRGSNNLRSFSSFFLVDHKIRFFVCAVTL